MQDKVPGQPYDLAAEQRRILRGSVLGLAICAVVVTGFQVLLPRLFRMPTNTASELLSFWAGCAMLTVVWVFVGFALVSRGRRHSLDDIRGSAFAPPSQRIAIEVAFLQNTVEQALMAIPMQAAVLFLAGSVMAPAVAGQTMLFGLGRVAFRLGYPKGAGGRALGVALTALPTMAGLCLSIWLVCTGIAARLV